MPIFVWGKRRFSWCLFAQEFFADLVDIAGAHGDQEVTGLAVFQKVVFDFIEGWEVFTGSSQFLDSFLKVGGRDAEGVGFSCGVDVCQYYMVCQSQCFGEFREQSFGTGVGMGLE